MKYNLLNSFFLFSVLVSACSPRFAVNADQDTQVSFEDYKTFAVVSEPSADVSQDPVFNSSLNQERLRRSIRETLLQKGYRETAENPDLEIRFFNQLKDRQETQTFNNGPIFWRFYGVGGNQVYSRSYEEGTLFIEAREGQSQRLLWQGWAIGEINYASKKYRDRLSAKIEQILDKFPEQSSSAPKEITTLP